MVMSRHYQVEAKSPQYQVSILQKSVELEDCLTRIFQVDPEVVACIQTYLKPLLYDEQYHSVIDAMITCLKKLNFPEQSSKTLQADEYDAVLRAPKSHEVLFENAQVRILRGVVDPGESVPFHCHAWDHLMLVIQEGDFRGETMEGSVEYDYMPIGFYEYPGDKTPYTFLNIGDTQFKALSFEIKR